MGLRIEDILRSLVKQGVAGATGYLAGQAEGEERRQKRELTERELRLAAARAAREEEDRRDRYNRQAETDRRRSVADMRDEEERQRKRDNPFEANGVRYPTEQAMLDALRRRATVSAEVSAAHRAPRAERSTRTTSVQSATGDARRWFGPGRSKYPTDLNATVKTLRGKYPDLTEGQAWKIVQDAKVWGDRQRENSGSTPNRPRSSRDPRDRATGGGR